MRTCPDCGALFETEAISRKRCPPCAAARFRAKHAATNAAWAKAHLSSPFRQPCTVCGLRLVNTHNGQTKCGMCREKRDRIRRSLARIGMEAPRVVSGGAFGQGKHR